MRAGMFDMLLAVAGICLLPAGLWAQTDANAPWDPNEHLVAYPRTCQLSAGYVVPEYGEPAWMSFEQKINLSARIAIPDPNGLIGLSTSPSDIAAWDEFGTTLEPVYEDEQEALIYAPLTYAATIWMPEMTCIVEAAPYDISFDLQVVAPEGPFPASLSRVEWSMNALLSDQFETVDLPFAPTDDWVEIAPGLEILIEETTIAEGRYEYRLQTRFDPNQVLHPDYCPPTSPADRIGEDEGYRWTEETSPEMVVIAVEVLDAEGNSVHYQADDTGGNTMIGLSSDGEDADGLTIVNRYEVGTCRVCGQATFLRHTIAYVPYEQGIRLVMEDVVLPDL